MSIRGNTYNENGKVEDWKRMTMMSGKINRYQMENLKSIPWAILENPIPKDLHIKVEYDLGVDFDSEEGRGKSGKVVYDFVTSQTLSYNEKLIALLEGSLRKMFWEGLGIHLLYNGEEFWSNCDGRGR